MFDQKVLQPENSKRKFQFGCGSYDEPRISIGGKKYVTNLIVATNTVPL